MVEPDNVVASTAWGVFRLEGAGLLAFPCLLPEAMVIETHAGVRRAGGAIPAASRFAAASPP